MSQTTAADVPAFESFDDVRHLLRQEMELVRQLEENEQLERDLRAGRVPAEHDFNAEPDEWRRATTAPGPASQLDNGASASLLAGPIPHPEQRRREITVKLSAVRQELAFRREVYRAKYGSGTETE